MSTLTEPAEVTPTQKNVGEVPAVTVGDGFGAAWMLARREWVRFFRQRNRVTAAILQPLLFWLLFGTGLKGSFEGAGQMDFLQFFLPGTVALDRSVHGDLCHDFGDRRSPRGIHAVGAGRTGGSLASVGRQSSRWLGHRLGASGLLLDACLSCRDCSDSLDARSAVGTVGTGRRRHVFAGNDRGLADGEHSRISCHHDARFDADVAAQRIVLSDPGLGCPGKRRAMAARWYHEGESAELFDGRDAAFAVSRSRLCGSRIRAPIVDLLAGDHHRCVVNDLDRLAVDAGKPQSGCDCLRDLGRS